MRICSPQLGISPDSNLGGEVHDREILKALAGLGVEIEIILPLGKKHEKVKGWNIHYLPLPFVYPPWLFNIFILPYLFWIYKKKPFEILRIHSPYFVGPGAIFFKKFYPKVKIIATYHHLEKNHRFYNTVDRFLINKYDEIVTVSQATRADLLEKFGLDETKIKVIPNGIAPKFKPCPKDEFLLKKYNLTNKKVLLYLGQLIERKNIGFLFEVLKKLPQEYALVIAGAGPQKAQLQERVRDLNLTEQVVFTGFVEEKDKIKYYNLADIFVYSSLKEGFGLSVLEAMACGVPVLTSNLPVFAAVIDNGIDGYLLQTDSDKWAEKIIELFEGENLLKKTGLEARKKAKKFSWKESATEYLEIL